MQERRLAAIMLVLRSENVGGPTCRSFSEGRPVRRSLCEGGVTDIVSYKALMGSDEDRAFVVLQKNRTEQKPIIEKYRSEGLKRCIDERDSYLHFLNICPTKGHHIPDELRFNELMNKADIKKYKADLRRDQKK